MLVKLRTHRRRRVLLQLLEKVLSALGRAVVYAGMTLMFWLTVFGAFTLLRGWMSIIVAGIVAVIIGLILLVLSIVGIVLIYEQEGNDEDDDDLNDE